MRSSKPEDGGVSLEFLDAFRKAAGPDGRATFADFMQLALYHPTLGYYRRDRVRVGANSSADFFTSTTSNPVFGELVLASVHGLLPGKDFSTFTFVEIGAEPGHSILNGIPHPFAEVRTIRLDDAIELAGPCVVFSNELFDAQPFRRFRFRENEWVEIGVGCSSDRLFESEIAGHIPVELAAVVVPPGYRIDYPQRSLGLLQEIAGQPWEGLFLAFDYGKMWAEIISDCPAGTARAYTHHRQSNDLLAQPGEQDLTCHICWDWLMNGLTRKGFAGVTLEFQEAFFVHQAGEKIAEISAAKAGNFDPRKLSLLQLLHPANSGQKFQALHARRFS